MHIWEEKKKVALLISSDEDIVLDLNAKVYIKK